ncbi:MAG: hypothetical protein AAGL98_05890, partial [Planctomycetota bacterium]
IEVAPTRGSKELRSVRAGGIQRKTGAERNRNTFEHGRLAGEHQTAQHSSRHVQLGIVANVPSKSV